jgi:Leucine-rich repeat (LRR) protein
MKIKLLFLLFLASFSSFAQYVVVPHYVAKNGLIAYYPFNGNANDESGNQNHAIVNGATLTTDKDDNLNSAYSFDGLNSYIEANITNYPLKGESRSITGWFKAKTPLVSKELDFCLLNYGNIADPNYWFKISFYRKGYLDLQFDSKTAESQENYFNDVWTFFALTFDDATNTYSLYINGVYKMGGTADLYTNGVGNYFRIGRNKLNNYFEGKIDDIGIWNRVLSTKEISDLFTKTTKNAPPPPGITNIPDINFEKKLISIGLDSGNPDGKVLTSDISYLTNLNIASSSISDLTGIQDFKALQTLNISSNQLTNLNITNNLALNSLDCSSNQLTSIAVSKNIALEYLDCRINQLMVLDVSSNTALTTLICNSNKLTALDVSKNILLNKLTCYTNSLSILDVSKNVALTSLYCYSNQLITLDVSNNTALTSLICNSNQLTALDVSKNTSLTVLNCGSNKLMTLDISKNVSLIDFSCSRNQLTSLNLRNGNNINFININGNFIINPNLTCIQVDDVAYAKANWSKSKDATASYNTSCAVQQYTLIPDVNFEKKLIALGIDSGTTDGRVLTSSVSSLTSLDVSWSSISNLTGIQDFVALTSFNCSGNQLTNIDVSKNVTLVTFLCSSNQLTTLDVSQNIALTILNCESNQLVNLDVFNNTALTYLDCSNNQDLTTLDISKNNNVSLLTLNCYNNKLTALDVSKNTALTNLNCSSSQLTALDVSKNTALTNLVCSGNQLSEINLFNNVALDTLRCGSNKLIRLDVSKNINLKKLSCYNNKLESLNLKNGNNVNFENNNSYNISYKNNPSLTCIQVDDKTYSDANWSDFKDATASYSENCPPPYIIVSSEFEDKLIALGIDKDGKNGSVLLADISNVKSIDVSNSGITNLSGIEYFTALEILICKGNVLTTINLSSNTALKYLDCSNNPLATLDVSKNMLLIELLCNGIAIKLNKINSAKTSVATQLNVLDLSNNLFLTKLNCSNNQLASLDVSKNTLLTDIDCSNNSLQNLNVSNGNNTNMLNVNFKSNSILSCIKVDDAAYSNANWAGAKDATAIYSKTACTLGIEDVIFDKISIYPNPVKGQLHIDNIVLEKVTVYDALGKLIKTTKFTNASDSNTLDLGGLTKGVYFIYLQSEGANSARKILVE